MNESLRLMITKRTKGSKGAMNRLRKEGFLPGSLSHKGSESVSFSVKRDEFRKALSANGMSSIYTLQLDPKTAYIGDGPRNSKRAGVWGFSARDFSAGIHD